jgi:hypothetical protein
LRQHNHPQVKRDRHATRGETLQLPLVGVGTVCGRQHTAEVEQILRSPAARGYRLHAFGAKVLGLGRYFRGRRVRGCSPTHRTEANCLRFALAWYQNLVTNLASWRPQDHTSTATVLQVAA